MTFLDLFAGIGGMRLAFEGVGLECVMSVEKDRFSRQTYQANFGEDPFPDVYDLDVADVPDHDVLVAGFPCQSFSRAGRWAERVLGRPVGFEDKGRGNLFFEIARLLEAKRPAAFLLENVRFLRTHENGGTFRTIIRALDKLDYRVHHQILNAVHYVPQNRERLFIVGFRADRFPIAPYPFPTPPPSRMYELGDVIETDVDPGYTLPEGTWEAMLRHVEKHGKRGHGFRLGIIDPQKDEFTRTLTARYWRDGAEILVGQNGSRPRRLTPRECARLMGFPDSFEIPVSRTQAYKQFGNSVAVPLVGAIAARMVEILG